MQTGLFHPNLKILIDDLVRQSHIAWICALGVVHRLANACKLIASNVSSVGRIVTAPPARDAMPELRRNDGCPGNMNLTAAQRDKRTSVIMIRFTPALVHRLFKTRIVVTVHSFTPIFHGTPRNVEIGILR
jgi:predicted N-formylglutamate amidohydrolase